VAERADPPTEAHGVPFREAARFWVKLGFINFGGPTGQISIMHEEIVERRRWITNGRFLHALNYCMLLPGPEAQQLAIYVGWLLHKVRGGLLAGIAFVLPSFFVMLFLSWLYVVHGDVTWVSATLSGLAAAVIGIVASATIRIGKKALANGLMVGIAVAAFVSIFLLHVPFPLIVLGAAAIGLVGGRIAPRLFDVGVGRELEENEAVAIRDDVAGARTRGRRCGGASSSWSSARRSGCSRSRRWPCGAGPTTR
jgi:chromate transporter